MDTPHFLVADPTDEFMTWAVPAGKDPVGDYGLSLKDGDDDENIAKGADHE
jgi:hypothetical protein